MSLIIWCQRQTALEVLLSASQNLQNKNKPVTPNLKTHLRYVGGKIKGFNRVTETLTKITKGP